MFILTAFTATAFGRLVGMILVGAVLIAGAYGVGYYNGRKSGVASYKAKIERAIKKSVAEGDKARAEALKEFDKNPDKYSDPFERKGDD